MLKLEIASRSSLVIALALLAGGSARADEKAPAGAMPPLPKPAPELSALKVMAGNWSCQGVTPAGAFGPGMPEMKYTSTFKVAPAHGGFAYTLAYAQAKSKTHPLSLEGAWYVGWDAPKKKLVFTWLDNMGSVGTQTATGWTGDDLVLTGEGVMGGQTVAVRDTLTRKGDKGLHWKGEMKPAGAPGWITIGEDDCKK